MYFGCIAGALPQGDYLQIISTTDFKDIEIKKTKKIELPEDLLALYLSDQGIKGYKENLQGIFSITVIGTKNKFKEV